MRYHMTARDIDRESMTAKAIVTLLAFLTFAFGVCAQDCSVKKPAFTRESPNGLFSVEIPALLRKDNTNYPDTTLYGSTIGDCVLVVYVIRHPSDLRLSFNAKIDGLEFMLGGDDDHDFSQELLRIGKYHAKKILYTKQNNQGLLIDAGDYTFVVGFASKNRKDLNGKIAKRLFSSFRIASHIIDI